MNETSLTTMVLTRAERYGSKRVMQGYYNRPQDTAEAIDADGWLHTGDVGSLGDEGFLTITDRKKDLIIASEGENIAPQPIEGLLKQDPLEVNKSLPGYAHIRTFALLQEPFSQERGELTPTLKVKRRVVAETRRAQIEALY